MIANFDRCKQNQLSIGRFEVSSIGATSTTLSHLLVNVLLPPSLEDNKNVNLTRWQSPLNDPLSCHSDCQCVTPWYIPCQCVMSNTLEFWPWSCKIFNGFLTIIMHVHRKIIFDIITMQDTRWFWSWKWFDEYFQFLCLKLVLVTDHENGPSREDLLKDAHTTNRCLLLTGRKAIPC